MQRFISLLMITLMAFWLPIQHAQAKRFGGGRSFGIQRNVNHFSRSSFQQAQSSFLKEPLKRSFASKWLAPIAGLLAGGLIASLLLKNGIGSGLLLWLGIGVAVLLLMNLLRRKNDQRVQNAYNGGYHHSFSPRENFEANSPRESFEAKPEVINSQSKPTFYESSSRGAIHANIPQFNEEAFLRDAKVQFIRLQSAYDSKNLQDLREFTSPEVFAEIQLQLQERDQATNQTNVIHLEAELLDVSKEPAFMQQANRERTLATVRFTGKIREEQQEEVPLNEIWHFAKDADSTRWIVAGVQQ